MLMQMNTETDFGEVTVEVKGGKIRIERERSVINPSISKIEPSLAIWRNQVSYRAGDRPIRSGNGLCGVFVGFNPEYPFLDDYIETDTIHSASCINLAINIFEFYPKLFDIYEQFRIISVLKDHDLGESERGDKADDGSTEHKEKFKIELEEFVRKIQYHTEEFQDVLIKDFIMFEHADSLEWDERSREIFQFAKLVDKTDALLSAFIYEKQGRKGSLLYKKKHFGGITGQDQYYSDQTREYSQAGIWSAHMIDHYKDYKSLKIFVDIVVAACRDVRGMIFPWFWEFLEKRDVFTEEERKAYVG